MGAQENQGIISHSREGIGKKKKFPLLEGARTEKRKLSGQKRRKGRGSLVRFVEGGD